MLFRVQLVKFLFQLVVNIFQIAERAMFLLGGFSGEESGESGPNQEDPGREAVPDEGHRTLRSGDWNGQQQRLHRGDQEVRGGVLLQKPFAQVRFFQQVF